MKMVRVLGARRLQALTAALVTSLVSSGAMAATDIAAITAAQTDGLAVVGALLALGIAIWGANYVRKKFFR